VTNAVTAMPERHLWVSSGCQVDQSEQSQCTGRSSTCMWLRPSPYTADITALNGNLTMTCHWQWF